MNNKTSEVSLITKDGFELAQRTATVLSKSDLVPKQFQNNLPNCIIAINMANRIGADPLMVMQNLYVVHGKPSWSSTFLISAINFSKKYKGALKFELSGEGDARQCIAWVTDLDGERLESPAVSIAMAKKEGWYSKTGSKWQTMPELMLRYRAAAFFSRIYCPEITMGMHTIDEVQDVEVLSSNIHSSVNISDELEKRIIIHINNATTIATLEQVANDLTDNTKTLYNDKYNEIQSKLFASSDSETKKNE